MKLHFTPLEKKHKAIIKKQGRTLNRHKKILTGFTKMHALGNDFVVIDNRVAGLKNISRLSKKLCHRKFGIGADQLLLLYNSSIADFKMRIFNPDGGEAEMCGNGIRCLGKYIWEDKLKTQNSPASLSEAGRAKLKNKSLSIETLWGIILLEKKGDLIKVDMGEPVFEAKKIPVQISKSKIIINYPLQIKDKTFKITCVSMGNPHAVIVVKDVASFPVSLYGPVIENHRLFPNRTNAEFIEILNRRNIKMRVWERGAGETMACGTGASASAVASVLLGLSDRKAAIHLSGGKLLIEWPAKNNHVYMTGPAVKVFEGAIEINKI
ncbi:MAG: diaminopimelate epimerase [Nitrospirae bacterium]|nr:diaminopimelate epimerase [Nitrospirota bacterium]